MPTSHPYQLNEIAEFIAFSEATSVLDVGVGFGKYGFLAREYLELWDRRQKYNDWQRVVEGIEVNEAYIGSLQRLIYNKIHIGNALDVMTGMKDSQFELIMVIDVLEHFSQEDGLVLLRECLRVGKIVLISTPKDIGTQGASFDNVYETHRYQWKLRDFKRFGYRKISNRDSLIVVLGDAEKIFLKMKIVSGISFYERLRNFFRHLFWS